MAVDERPGRSLLFDINNERLSAFADNGYKLSFFDDENDDEYKELLENIRRSELLYSLTDEERNKISRDSSIQDKDAAESALTQKKQEETRNLYAKFKVIQERLISPYNDHLRWDISNLEEMLDNLPSGEMSDELKAKRSEIEAQIKENKERIIESKITINPSNGELCIVNAMGRGTDNAIGFAIRDGKVTFNSEDAKKESIRNTLLALGYKEGILGDLIMPDGISTKLKDNILSIKKEDEKREELDRTKVHIYTEDEAEEELLDAIDQNVQGSDEDNIVDEAGSTTCTLEIPKIENETYEREDDDEEEDRDVVEKRVVFDRGELTKKGRKAKRAQGQNLILDYAAGLGYTRKRDLYHRRRSGWDCYYFTNDHTDKAFRLATKDPKTGKISYHYKFMVASKVDKDGNISFKYNTPDTDKELPYHLFEFIAEQSKKLGATHVHFTNTRGCDTSNLRKACAQELIVPTGFNVDIGPKHIAMMLETAQRDKGPNDPRVIQYAKNLAEQMVENQLRKNGRLTDEEKNTYNRLMNLTDVRSFSISDFNLSKFKAIFSGGIEGEFAKLSSTDGSLQAVDVVSKMIAFKDLYNAYKEVVTDPNRLDDMGNTTANVGHLMDKIREKHPDVSLDMLPNSGVLRETSLYGLEKGEMASTFGKELFDAMSKRSKGKAEEFLTYKYTIKGRPEVSSESVAANAIKELSGELSAVSADFKELVNNPNYSIYIPHVDSNVKYEPNKEAIDGYNQKSKKNMDNHMPTKARRKFMEMD